MTRRLVLLGVLGVVVLAVLRFGPKDSFSSKAVQYPEGETVAEKEPPPSSVRVIPNSWFELEYGADENSLKDDLEIVATTLTESQTMIKDFTSYFLPDNEALTSFLSGANRDRMAWIRPSHRAISGNGELLDRFGSPLFFHRETGTRFQVRSAGSDRLMWTDDDVVYPEAN